MLILHTSHHLENLSQQFAELVSKPLSNVFASEQVVIQNPEMGHWLSMQMAQQLGISANYQYFSPANFMWSLLRKVVDTIPQDDPSQVNILRWRLFSLFLCDADNYPELQHYINNELAAWDLADALAPILDQYLFYRPEWIAKWEMGNYSQKNWQARLWQQIMLADNNEHHIKHWLDLQNHFIAHFAEKYQTQYAGKFPERVSFFSISALSSGYLRLLAELSTKIEVHFFIVNPCRYYWGEIEAIKKQFPTISQQKKNNITDGNALLTSLGKQGREFFDQLYQLGATRQENYQEVKPTNLLQYLQWDILNQQQSKLNLNEQQSLQFHACHTAMREVEVLHDQILAVLEQGLNPNDIVVMVPDIEQYTPYIEAVFSTAEQALPFSIADLSAISDKPEVEIFLKLLDLPEQRFHVEAVFELLEYPEIYQYFNLDEKQILQCRHWAQETNIRWGISDEMRAATGLPKTYEHSWKYGLDRMLLGYMMPSEDLFDDSLLLPFNQIEGNNAQVLSAFKCFTDAIFQLWEWSLQTLTVEKWKEKLQQLVNNVFPEAIQQAILNTLDILQQQQQLAQFEQPISFPLIKQILNDLFSSSINTHFMSHGITFCALTPMRSIPFKMVALLGMNDGDFPRQDQRHSFDKIAHKSQAGDRSQRDEDRYLFLESILSARERFYISYIGQSVQDNGMLPPSVIVSELLDYLANMTGKTQEDWICKHPLQAFSPRYYNNTDNRLFSYVKEYIALQQSSAKKENTLPFISTKLEEPDAENKHITLEKLIQFYKSPARTFLKQRFAIQIFSDNNELPIREPFTLEAFIDTQLRESIATHYTKENTLHLARAKGLLPHGSIGTVLFEQQEQIVESFYSTYPQLLQLNSQQQSFCLQLDDFTLSGKLNDLNEIGCIKHYLGTYYSGDLLAIWLHHLVLNSVSLKINCDTKTYIYQPDHALLLESISDAKSILLELLKGYWQGLQFPLYYFPKPAYKMYEKSSTANLAAAKLAWDSDFFASEAEKFENKLLFAEQDVFNQEFFDFAKLTFGSMAQVRKELK